MSERLARQQQQMVASNPPYHHQQSQQQQQYHLHPQHHQHQDEVDSPSTHASSAATAPTTPGSGGGHIKFQTSVSTASSTPSSKGLYAHKLRSHTSKLRAQTNRIMSNLKGPPALTCTPVRRYAGHKDGIWEVSVSRMGLPILGTASADHTAMIWGMHSGQALLQYTGHSGSVNSLRFHPNKELVLTASGDGTVHIWQCAVHLYNESSSGRLASSEDELEGQNEKDYGSGAGGALGFSSSGMEDDNQFSILRTPLRSLNGHSGVAIAADWLPGGDQAVTAGAYDLQYYFNKVKERPRQACRLVALAVSLALRRRQ